MKAVILAGGYGKRLRPLTEEIPKPLIEVAGKPIIVWQIEWLKRHGIKDFIILVGYLRDRIIERIGSGQALGVKVAYVVEDEPLGTGGALKNAEHLLRGEEVFLVLNGDIITDLDPLKLVDALKSRPGAVGAIAAIPLRCPYGLLEITGEGLVKGFKEKPILRDYWVNAGVYALRSEILDYLPEKGDIERTAFPKLASEGRLLAVKYLDVYWRSIDTFKDVEEASRELEAST